MKKISIYFTVIVSLFVFSCARKDIDFNSFNNDEILKKIVVNNPFTCKYKSKAVIFFEDRFYKFKVRALLKKNCENDFTVYFLGAFNQIIASVNYVDGDLKILEKKKDVSADYRGFFTESRIKKIVMLFNVPIYYPKNIVDKKAVSENLLIRDDLNRIFEIDKNFRIVSIKAQDFLIRYKYENNNVKKIDYVDFSQKLSITFL